MRDFDPVREAEAARAIRESLIAMGEGEDAELLHDSIEGETGLFDIFDKLVAAEDEDLILLDGISARLAELTDRKRRITRRKDMRRAAIDQALAIAELQKCERPTYTLSLTKRPASVIVSEEADIPAEFFKSEPKLDKKAVADALKAGQTVPGACLSNAAPTVTIKRK